MFRTRDRRKFSKQLMAAIDLRFGSGSLSLDFDPGKFDVLEGASDQRPLSDIEIGERLDAPYSSESLEDLVGTDQTVLFVVPDATRNGAAGQIVNLLVRRLIANGTLPHQMAAIFATGIHRPVTADEKETILTPFLAQRLKTLDHSPRDLVRISRFGETASGIPIELNSVLNDFDHVITVGSVTFHYFAGFAGGRKLICPGLASSRTIGATHKLAFDCETLDRRAGVGPGLLEGNAVNEAFVEAASKVRSVFNVSTIVNDRGEATDVFCGDVELSHRAACDAYAAAQTITIGEQRSFVVVSCGGSPYDINLIQAHKALDAAVASCSPGGTIIWIAECADGLGRADLLEWFRTGSSGDIARKLCEKYQVNGQTAWSLRTKTESFDVKMVTALAAEDTNVIGLTKITADEMNKAVASSGFIIPFGSKILIKVS
jgi:nickel-dependent lactate racemase